MEQYFSRAVFQLAHSFGWLVCPWLTPSSLAHCPWLPRSALALIAHLIARLCTPGPCSDSDPNMDAFYLGMLVMVGTKTSKFKPPLKAIKERYYSKFRGKGGEHEEPTA